MIQNFLSFLSAGFPLLIGIGDIPFFILGSAFHSDQDMAHIFQVSRIQGNTVLFQLLGMRVIIVSEHLVSDINLIQPFLQIGVSAVVSFHITIVVIIIAANTQISLKHGFDGCVITVQHSISQISSQVIQIRPVVFIQCMAVFFSHHSKGLIAVPVQQCFVQKEMLPSSLGILTGLLVKWLSVIQTIINSIISVIFQIFVYIHPVKDLKQTIRQLRICHSRYYPAACLFRFFIAYRISCFAIYIIFLGANQFCNVMHTLIKVRNAHNTPIDHNAKCAEKQQNCGDRQNDLPNLAFH